MENSESFDASSGCAQTNYFAPLARVLSDALWGRDPSTRRITGMELAEGAYEDPAYVLCNEAWKGRLHPDDRDRVVSGIEAATRGSSKMMLNITECT